MKKVYPVCSRIIFPLINKIFIKEIIGLDNLPKKGPYIIAANHQSYIDPFLIAIRIVTIINRKIYFISTVNFFYKLCGKTLAEKWAKCIPLTDDSKKETLEHALNILKEGKIVGVHPEGTFDKSSSKELKYGKTGAARLALWAEVPIVPIGIINSDKILPVGSFLVRPKKAIIKIGKPLYFNEYYNKKITKKLLVSITARMMKEIGKLADKGYNPKNK